MTLIIPMPLPSLANMRGAWQKRARIIKQQRGLVAGAMRSRFVVSVDGSLPCLVVTLTRIAARPLDGDNWQAAAKACRDGVADAFGCDDSAKAPIEWRYQQERGAPRYQALRIEVEEL